MFMAQYISIPQAGTKVRAQVVTKIKVQIITRIRTQSMAKIRAPFKTEVHSKSLARARLNSGQDHGPVCDMSM